MTLTKSSRDLSKQLGVWIRPELIGIDAVSRSSPFGSSARHALGQLAISVPSEQWFDGKRSVYVLVRDNLESARRRTALNYQELKVLGGADSAGGREGTARRRRGPLGGRERTVLVRKALASGRERTALKLGELTTAYPMRRRNRYERNTTADSQRRATAAAAWNRPRGEQRCGESQASVDVRT